MPGKKTQEKEAEVLRTFESLIVCAERMVSSANVPLLYDPRHHNVYWHAHSLIKHCQWVIDAAVAIKELTAVDATLAAVYHDLGKFTMFDEVVAGEREDFAGHEAISAELAAKDGLPETVVWAIREHLACHRKSVGGDPDKFAALAGGERERLRQLVVLSAADAVGRGWPRGQRRQRPRIAELLGRVAREHLDDDRLATVVERAVGSWR